MDHDALDRLLAAQDGVVARRQVLDVGGTDVDLARLVRRRVLARLHDGVLVDHTGEPTWRQRAWGAVLFHRPAVLAGSAALRAAGLGCAGGTGDPIEVLVAHGRRVRAPAGVRVSRSSDFDAVALVHLSPPRARIEHAVLTVASRARTDDALVAVLGDACQSRHTTPERLVVALESRPRLARRALLAEVLDDVAGGALSALERRYLRDVEVAHRLPRGRRQRREVLRGVVAYRDVSYPDQHTYVELDGRLGHEWTADRWADLERDVDVLVAGRVTLRAGWRQVLDPCRLAAAVGAVLASRGWDGSARRCGDTCTVSGSDRGDPRAPGARRSPRSA